MAYATAAELRERYRQGLAGVDEFAHRDDADLDQALTAASAEIDSWRPLGAVSLAAAAVLKDKCLILARMLIHQDEALGDDHPVVRDGLEVRRWLRALAAGTVQLPIDEGETPVSPRVIERTLVYDDTWLARYTV